MAWRRRSQGPWHVHFVGYNPLVTVHAGLRRELERAMLGAIRSIRNGTLVAVQAWSAHHASFERPQFVLPAAVAFASCLVFLFTDTWPSTFFLVPAAVLGCRYYELARYRAVHRSGLLFVLILLCSFASILWTMEHRLGEILPLELALAGAWLGLGACLFFVQSRLQQGRGSHVLPYPYECEPCWAFGGFLAILPVIFLVGFGNGLVAWRSPLTMLWGLCGVALLVLQVRRHGLFPRLTLAWLVLWLFDETIGVSSSTDSDWNDGPLIAYCAVLLMVVLLGTYLEFSPRVRRTFAAPAA